MAKRAPVRVSFRSNVRPGLSRPARICQDRRIARILKEQGIPPVPGRPTSWQTFLRAHWGALAGADVLTMEVWTCYAELECGMRGSVV
jgi:hypothetical protein